MHKFNTGLRLSNEYACKNIDCGIVPTIEEPNIMLPHLLQSSYLRAKKNQDYFEIAKFNSYFSSEAFNRLDLFSKGWAAHTDKETGLIPYRTNWGDEYKLYLPEQSAADFYPFLLLATYFTNKSRYNETMRWADIEEKYRYETGLPAAVDLNTNQIIYKNVIVNYNINRQIFGASEMIKDGLLPLIEFFGKDNDFYHKAVTIMGNIFKNCPYTTRYGCLPSLNSEVNGEILISLSRLYLMSRNEDFLRLAEPIAQFYLFDVLPNNDYLPCSDFDINELSCRDKTFSLGDHSGEIIPGLVEFYYAKSISNKSQSEIYSSPIKKMLDKVAVYGLSEDGFWYHSNQDHSLSDTWGYIHNAYHLFSLSNDEDFDFVNRSLNNLKNKNIKEFAFNADDIADSIEGAIYLQYAYQNDVADDWINENIFYLFAQQKENGLIEGNYKDGNVARTWILYALYKTQGTYLIPWRNDVKVGAAKNKDRLYLYLESTHPWKGVIKFDYPRSNEYFGVDYYPRINSFPEWWVVEKNSTYRIIKGQDTYFVNGHELIGNGLNMELLENDEKFVVIEKIE